MTTRERQPYRRLAAIWVASAALLVSATAARAEPPLPKVMTQEEAAWEAKQQQAKAAWAAKQQQEEAELTTKKMSDWWNRKRSTLPESGMAHDLPAQDSTITDTQRQDYRPDVTSAAEAGAKPAKPAIPKAGRSQLPRSSVEDLHPTGSATDRQFRRDSNDKKTKPFWAKPKGW